MPTPEELDIQVNRDECSGCSACVNEAPETFELDDENLVVVKSPVGDAVDVIVDAASACPTETITVVDKTTGAKLAPKA